MHEKGKPLAIDHIDIPDVRPTEVLVRVKACGLVPNLQNVLQKWDEIAPDLPLPEMPAIFGLDVSGVVESVGERVRDFSPGDRVYVNPLRFCGSCSACRNGHSLDCDRMILNGYFGIRPESKALFEDYRYGGYAEFMPAPQNSLVRIPDTASLPQSVCHDPWACPGRQTGGRAAGLAVLNDFLQHRGEMYSGSISSPVTAESGCSRLSPHIANGTLSLREIAQRTTDSRTQTLSPQRKKSLSAFHTRLWWHCYFIQTLENRPEMEEVPLVPQMGLLERPFSQERFNAWKNGRTGWPMVDACMRYLHHHGWINFRMRAMLVSAACWSLSLPSGPVAAWLAQLFVDYDPGIHYPQIQMQSGMAANGVLRIYNPVMQAHSLDPDARFVRTWVPELRDISDAWIFEPWKMPSRLQKQAEQQSGVSVSLPLVDFALEHRQAKAAVASLRQRHGLTAAPGFREKPDGQHTRRPATRKETGVKKKKDAQQLDLF